MTGAGVTAGIVAAGGAVVTVVGGADVVQAVVATIRLERKTFFTDPPVPEASGPGRNLFKWNE